MPRPWVALAVGCLPVIGNTAFLIQIVSNGAGRRENVARFMIYHLATRLGQMIPIWGAADTETEHRLNRLVDRLLSTGSLTGRPVA